MTATITALCTDMLVLRRRYASAVAAFEAHLSFARMDDRLRAYKAWLVKSGPGWEQRAPAAMEAERRACVARMKRAGGKHAPPAG